MTLTRLMMVLALAVSVGLAAFSCQPSTSAPKSILIGIVAKSQGNPVFQAAHAGARDAAKFFSEKYGIDVKVDIQTPSDEDGQKQAQAIEQLARANAQGIAVACSDANVCKGAIDKAVDLGVKVVCFDSDSPESKRFCFYGTDDITCGGKVMQELAKVMGDKGTIAILAGNQSAPNLRKRVEGVKQELAKHPGMKLLDDGVFYHEETAEKAAQCIRTAQSTHPEIQGWALVGGWPLFTQNGLDWKPGSVKVISVDALPPQLAYLKNDYVAELWAQDCYSWGYKSVEILVEKIRTGKDPEGAPRIIDPLSLVTKENADEWAAKWAKWAPSK
jgi:ribose transport system substrate-binding protein